MERDATTSSSDARVLYVDRGAWQSLASASTANAFADAWLSLQCTFLSDVAQAVVVLRDGGQGWRPAAIWPKEVPLAAPLTDMAERALAEQQGIVEHRDGQPVMAAYPVLVERETYGVVAVLCAPGSDPDRCLRELQWGSAWLESFERRNRGLEDGRFNERLLSAVDLLALALDQPGFDSAALAGVTQLATTMHCDRVSLGLKRGHKCRLSAMSHSADPSRQMNLVRRIEAAMDEALDAGTAIGTPALNGTPTAADHAHRALVAESGGAVLTVPLHDHDQLAGAITFERADADPFDAETLEQCRAVCALLGAVLLVREREDRPLWVKTRDSLTRQLGRFVGPGYLGRKLIGLVVAAVLAFLVLAHGTYRVAADARLEGQLRRVVTAPLSGYVVDAPSRAGDTVSAGDALFKLDDRELRLERAQRQSERVQVGRERQEASAQGERARLRVLDAQLASIDAQINLLDAQIERAVSVAPLDGLIVQGDLSQSLGAAVERGQVLFEIAPLSDYRIVLDVDEHDIRDVTAGQTGALKLASLPGEALAFTVTAITPVSEARDGVNVFRVEATLDDQHTALRPGMQGVAKIDIGERRLIDIWTRDTRRWLRLAAWSHLP